ncbi:hypothetical protein AQJ23_20525 [Streptomyces antibioticus]|nr:hypothetical protein AQJ23_20525 [Streptomyces antibioticus]
MLGPFYIPDSDSVPGQRVEGIDISGVGSAFIEPYCAFICSKLFLSPSQIHKRLSNSSPGGSVEKLL